MALPSTKNDFPGRAKMHASRAFSAMTWKESPSGAFSVGGRINLILKVERTEINVAVDEIIGIHTRRTCQPLGQPTLRALSNADQEPLQRHHASGDRSLQLGEYAG